METLGTARIVRLKIRCEIRSAQCRFYAVVKDCLFITEKLPCAMMALPGTLLSTLPDDFQ